MLAFLNEIQHLKTNYSGKSIIPLLGFHRYIAIKLQQKPKLGKLFAIVPILAFFTRILILIIPETGMKHCRQQHQFMFLSTLFGDLPNINSSFCWLQFHFDFPVQTLT